jgi:toluene monooxygenase system ferredoxin subunit
LTGCLLIEESTMAFVSVCEQAALQEGQMGLFRVGKRSVLLVWPRGGEVKAYRGRCPHQDIPLDNATFDGKTIICGHHQWKMDAATGACIGRIVTHKCGLAPYAMRCEGEQVQVDLP